MKYKHFPVEDQILQFQNWFFSIEKGLKTISFLALECVFDALYNHAKKVGIDYCRALSHCGLGPSLSSFWSVLPSMDHSLGALTTGNTRGLGKNIKIFRELIFCDAGQIGTLVKIVMLYDNADGCYLL